MQDACFKNWLQKNVKSLLQITFVFTLSQLPFHSTSPLYNKCLSPCPIVTLVEDLKNANHLLPYPMVYRIQPESKLKATDFIQQKLHQGNCFEVPYKTDFTGMEEYNRRNW